MLGVIYHEFTGKKPTRTTPISENAAERSRFYEFADASFAAIGHRVHDAALRWVTEHWDEVLEPPGCENELELIFGGLDKRDPDII